MPCDEIRTYTLNFDAPDVGVLERTLKTYGFKVERNGDQLSFRNVETGTYGTFIGGTFSLRGGAAQEDVAKLDNLKQDYARESVYAAAEAFGWAVTADPQDAYHLSVERQTY